MSSDQQTLRKSYIWYSLGGLLNAGQSALLLMVISRTNAPEAAGVYAIGYAIACLAITVGNFGVRNYQATDMQHKYSFQQYLSARIITDILMLLVVGFYLIKGYFFLGYSISKCLVIFLLGCLKLVDSIEDVFHGMFQNKGRLDLAGMCMASRLMLMLVSFSVGLVLSHNLTISALLAVIISFGYFVIVTHHVYGQFREPFHISLFQKENVKICVECFSLFVGGFLAIYIANAPKYAIDEFCSEIEQAKFNYIFMPVYVVNVLNSFIYQPMLTRMATCYEHGQHKDFLRLFFRQILCIIGLVSCVLLAGYFLGIPVLNILYNTELADYKTAFMVLLIGSGFLATEGYVAAIITIMRKQNWLLIGYGTSALIALLAARRVTLLYGVFGAACLYSGIVMIQMIIFIILFCIFYSRARK